MRTITIAFIFNFLASLPVYGQFTGRPENARDSFFIVKYDDTTTDATKNDIRQSIELSGGNLEKTCKCNEDLELWKVDPVNLEIVRMGASDKSGVDTTDYDYEMTFENIADIDDFTVGNFTPTATFSDETYKEIRPVNLRAIKAAIIDSGVEKGHPLLGNYLWQTAANNCAGVSEIGYDVRNDSPEPTDSDNHGTGVNGVMAINFPQGAVELQNGKFYDGQGNSFDAVCAMYMAIEDEMKVLNLSFGFESNLKPLILDDVIRLAAGQDILMVASAGNEGDDNDIISRWPSNFQEDYPNNLMVVGAYHIEMGSGDTIYAPYSNFGANRVNIAAPGHQVSTNNASGTNSMFGTSIAAPYVSRLAVALWNDVPEATPQQIIECIESNAIPIASMVGENKVGGIVNPNTTAVCAAVLPIDMHSVSIQLQQNNSVEIDWVANQTDDSYFEILHSSNSIDWIIKGSVHGEQNKFDYTYKDNHPKIGTNYYQIVQHLPDGEVFRSDILVIQITADHNKIRVFPNPIVGNDLWIDGLSTDTTTYEVFNALGGTVLSGLLHASNIQKIDISSLNSGTYHIKISHTNGAHTNRRLIIPQ